MIPPRGICVKPVFAHHWAGLFSVIVQCSLNSRATVVDFRNARIADTADEDLMLERCLGWNYWLTNYDYAIANTSFIAGSPGIRFRKSYDRFWNLLVAAAYFRRAGYD